MLFNSALFIYAFLPLTVLGYGVCVNRFGHRQALGFLVAASLVFYGYWNPNYLVLLAGSIAVNFVAGRALARNTGPRRAVLIAGITANLGLLGFFKYANFVVRNVESVTGAEIALPPIALPLAISFFTFQQIAFLVDTYRGEAREPDLLRYGLFVAFFPQLIAGPIVHHSEVMPQFADPDRLKIRAENLATGGTLFAMGLFKKVVLADPVADYSDKLQAAIDTGYVPTLFEAWGGTLAFTFQIYFDFSGYSDMAIGLALLFGIQIPVNFFSPYRSTNIIEFWRRWHITLSRFLRDYLYIPLGGNRKGTARRYVNLMVTMLLGGLWHGAGWNFVLWGGLHGLYLLVNHAWRKFRRSEGPSSAAGGFACWALTFFAVVVAWVPFNAATTEATYTMYRGMIGLNGISLPLDALSTLNGIGGMGDALQNAGVAFVHDTPHASVDLFLLLGALMVIACLVPNTAQLFAMRTPGVSMPSDPLSARLRFQINRRWCAFTVVLLIVSMYEVLSERAQEFLYFVF